MKLMVDDIRKPPTRVWSLSRNITDAIRTIDANFGRLTHVILDYDKSHAVRVDGVERPFPCGETFEPVARFIAALGGIEGRRFKIVIQTANETGARIMAALFDESWDVEIRIVKPCNRLESPVDQEGNQI